MATGSEALSAEQRLGLIDEVLTARGFLRAGVEALEEIGSASPSYQLPLLLLAQGLERLMKVALALVQLQDAGALPTGREMREFGHDLTGLLDRCAAIASRPSYCVRPAASADADFLASDPDLRGLIEVIAAYGGGERYADLGRFLGDPAARRQDPAGRMDSFERSIMSRHAEWHAWLREPTLAAYHRALVHDLSALVLRLARAVSRFFAWDLAGELGREVSSMLLPIITLRDDNLGALPRQWRSA